MEPKENPIGWNHCRAASEFASSLWPDFEPTHAQVRRTETRRRAALGRSSVGVHGLPVRSSMYSRIKRRKTCEGVRSSCAHSRSNSSFLRGSTKMVSRAVRSSVVKLNSH